jgi:hypothetical protein
MIAGCMRHCVRVRARVCVRVRAYVHVRACMLGTAIRMIVTIVFTVCWYSVHIMD